MKPSDVDWQYLRDGLLLPLVVAAAGVAALTLSLWKLGGTGSMLDARQQQLADLDQQRTELAVRLRAREKYAARFRELRASGFAGAEQRLAWAQAIRDSATALGLPYVRYAVGPQQQFTAPWLPGDLATPVAVTTVDLQVGLVHELDLLRLLERLHEAPGLLDVAGCALERADENFAPAPDRANLAGSCRLRWFSIPVDRNLLVAEAGA